MNDLPLPESKFRLAKFLCLSFLLIFTTAINAFSQNLNLDNSFNAGVSDAQPNVYTSTAQPDGKVLVGGLFHFANGVQRQFLVRLNADGTLDNSFNVGNALNGAVYEIIVLADGKILIGGSFTAYNGAAKGGLARLNSDGTLDATFNGVGVGAVGGIQTISIQTDGKILASGSVTSYNGVIRFSVLRVNADGTLDTTFISPFTTSQFVEEVDVQPDGKILVGGDFLLGANYNDIARLNADGSLDTTFSAGGTDGSVYALTIQPDGKILIGGSFFSYQNNFRPKIARLNANGSLDTTFNSGSLGGASVEYFAIQPDGKILVAGAFFDFFDQQFSVVRFNADGSLDNTFQPIVSNEIGYSVKIQTDGRVLLTGFFTRFNNENRRGIARLNANGSLDVSFNAMFTNFGTIETIARQADGKIVVAGTFQKANGATNFNVARFNQNGALDTTFNVGAGTRPDEINTFNQIYDIAVQPDGKILVGGNFGYFNGVFLPAIARLNTDGSVDTSFSPSFFNVAQLAITYDIFVQADGKIIVGGSFLDFSGQTFKGLARLNSNGSLDSTFNFNGIGVNNTVRQIAQQPDGKLLIGGAFSTYNGQSRNRIARLNADGSLDASFNPGTGGNGTVLEIAVQTDGKIVIGGTFTTFNAVSRVRLARLNADGSLDATFNVGTGVNSTVNAVELLPNGKIIIGGLFSAYNGATSNRLARINADGSFDNTFVSGFTNNPIFSVRDVLIQPDGGVLVGGIFDSYNGAPRNSFLRLTNAAASAAKFDFDGDGKADVSVFRPENGAWYLQQSTNGFAAISFGQAGDKLVPADYDGDGVTDVAVYRNGNWYLQRSQLGFIGITFGNSDDVPQPADFDGDGKAELAVFRPSNGTWYVLNLTNNQFTALAFGQNGDKPAVGDYDGDGKADYAVNRGGNWYLQRSAAGFAGITFGNADDRLVPADYDGDGKTDIAVFRPANGVWYLLQSQAGFVSLAFGFGTDTPVPADYDGDRKADIAVVRNGNWYLQRSTGGFTGIAFGTSGDTPIPNVFVK